MHPGQQTEHDDDEEAAGQVERPDQQAEYEQTQARAWEALSETDATLAWETGKAMTLQQAVAFAQEIV